LIEGVGLVDDLTFNLQPASGSSIVSFSENNREVASQEVVT